MTPTETAETASLRELFGQVDRRLELIEDDARRFNQERVLQIDQVHTRINQLDERLTGRIDQHFRWLVGLFLTGGTAILGLLVRLSLQ